MIPVVMEPSMLNQLFWTGPVGMDLGSILYVDLTSDDPAKFEAGLDHLYREIIRRVRFCGVGIFFFGRLIWLTFALWSPSCQIESTGVTPGFLAHAPPGQQPKV